MISRKTRMPLISLFAALSFFSLPLAATHAQVTLTVGKGSALPGATESPVAVSLDNKNDKVRGITLDICDAGDYLTCPQRACALTDRTPGFTCAQNEVSGCCRVNLVSLGGDAVDIGQGPVFEVLYDVAESAQECVILDQETVNVANEELVPLDVTSESGGFCFPCATNENCDDGLYCTGEESCTGDACVLGTNPCPDGTACDENSDECVTPSTTTTAGPSSTTTTGPSTTTTTTDSSTTTTGPSSTTTTVSDGASIEVISDNSWKSRWVALPSLVVIKGNETSFQPFKTTIAYDPRDAIFKLFPIVLGNDYIWNIVLVMPGWFAGTGDQEVTVTVTTGDEIVSDSFLIQELPFILEQK